MNFNFNTLSATQVEYLEKSLSLLQGIELEDYLHPSQFELDFLVEAEVITEATQQHYENVVPSLIDDWNRYLNNRQN